MFLGQRKGAVVQAGEAELGPQGSDSGELTRETTALSVRQIFPGTVPR